MVNTVKVWNIGRVLYRDSDKLQKFLCKLHHLQNPRIKFDESLIKMKDMFQFETYNTLLVMEHKPVYTTGLRDYLNPEEIKKLEALGAEYYKVDRGGLVTFHGPGQLTAYPIINLRQFKPSVKWYVCKLEECIIETCKRIGIPAGRSPHTGIWVDDKKICALGIHVSHGITTHGLALNCCTDLNWFNHIVPCGIEGKGVTSISNELGKNVTINEILPVMLDSFKDVFNCNIVNITDNESNIIIKTLEEHPNL